MAASTTSFAERIARIEQARTKQAGKVQIYVGEDNGWVKGPDATRGLAPKPRTARPAPGGQLAGFFGALTLGFLGTFLAVAGGERVLSDGPSNVDAAHAAIGLASALLLAFMLAFMVVQMFRPRARKLAWAQIVGMGAAVFFLVSPLGGPQSQLGAAIADTTPHTGASATLPAPSK